MNSAKPPKGTKTKMTTSRLTYKIHGIRLEIRLVNTSPVKAVSKEVYYKFLSQG